MDFNIFGIIGMGVGVMGYFTAINAIAEVNKLKKQLAESGVIKE